MENIALKPKIFYIHNVCYFFIFFIHIILLSYIFLGCHIQSATSPSASTLDVVWDPYTGATLYYLELRVINSTSIAAVTTKQNPPNTEIQVQGLRPGLHYEITLKVFNFLSVVSTCKYTAMTGKENI